MRVLAVLVASDGAASWLPDVLTGLSAQTHRPLDVIALDNATRDGSAAILSQHLNDRRILTVDEPLPYSKAVAAILDAAREAGAGADAYLFLHDDCALDPDALEKMVEALEVPDVGIVAPRLVEWDQPEILQDIGQTTDRFGRAVPRVEKGELDQGQVDGTRAVLYVHSAAMLAEAALIDRIGAFDERFEALREDLDLCWRARICGRLTVVAGDARARHAHATVRGLRPGAVKGRVRELADRHLIASLIKNYGVGRALFAVPATIAISFANALLFVAAGRRRLAGQVLRALTWNVRNLTSTLAERHRVQKLRISSDRELSRLQHRGARRLRAAAERIMERLIGGEVSAIDDDRDFDAPPPTLVQRLRAHPGVIVVLVAALLGIIATRGIFAAGPLAGADHGRFPAEPGLFFQEFASGWRGLSGPGPATPGLIVLGIWSFITFASTWLAHRLMIAAIVPLAALSIARLVKRCGLGRTAQVVAAAAYALGPVVLGAYADGRILEAFAAIGAPVVIGRMLVPPKKPSTAVHVGLGVATIVTAIISSLSPWTLVLVGLAGASIAATRREIRPLRTAGVVVVASLAALLPWSIELFKPGTPLLAGGRSLATPYLDMATLDPHGILRLSVSLGLVAAALLGAALARPKYRGLVLDAGGLMLVGLGMAVAGRWVPILGPRPGLPLILSAVGAAILVAVGADAIVAQLARRTFGVPHLATFFAALAITMQAFGTVSFLATGAHPGVQAGRGLVPEFFEDVAARGDFRILWLDGTSRRPRFALTGPNGLTMLEHLDKPAGGAYAAAERAVEIITGRAGAAAGRILGTLGVRYVFVRPTASDELVIAVGDQTDLAFEQEVGGAKIYSNAIDIPVATAMRAPAWTRVSSKELDAAQGVETNPSTGDPLIKVNPTEYEGAAPQGTRAILLGQPFHSGWKAQVGDSTLEPRPSFGWAVGFDLEKPTQAERLPVTLAWGGQWVHRIALIGWLLILFVMFASWSRTAAPEDLT